MYGVPPREQRHRIAYLLELVGLTGRERDRVEGYSRGMRQHLHIARGLLHSPEVLFLSSSTVEITIALLVQATLVVYLFRAGSEPHHLLQAAVGAGLMGAWPSVRFGSGGAIQNQRWQGTLEMLMQAPRRPALVILPITLATALTGAYAMIAALVWGRLLYSIRWDFAHPLAFAIAAPVCILALGLFGLLLAAAFVLMRNANALANTLEYPIWLLSGCWC